MQFREDTGTGYMYCYAPSHHCANAAGKVLEHVYVMSNLIGRKLDNGECVHHIDRNRKNNSPSNLRLMSIKDHARLHQVEDNGVAYKAVKCTCGKQFTVTVSSTRIACSKTCLSLYGQNRRFNISAEELSALVWSIPTVQISKIFGVSDVAIAKRCKILGVSKPPRGYWSKVSTDLP